MQRKRKWLHTCPRITSGPIAGRAQAYQGACPHCGQQPSEQDYQRWLEWRRKYVARLKQEV